MAIVWSAVVGSGFGAAQLGFDAVWGKDAEGYFVNVTAYLLLGATNGDEVTFTWSGAASGSRKWTHKDPTRTWAAPIQTKTIRATPGQNITVGGAMSGVWSGNNPSFSISTRAPYANPVAATDLAVVRVNDAKQNLTWDVPSSATGPAQTLRVLRRLYGTTSWQSIASFPNATTKLYSDTSTQPDKDYEWAIESRNTSQNDPEQPGRVRTTISPPVRLQTTPAAPSSVSAAKSGADIVVTIVPASSIQCSHLIEHTQDDGVTWEAVETLPPGEVESVHASPSTSYPHRYRATAITPTNELTSTATESNTVTLIAPPNAPTQLTPNGGAVDIDGTVTLGFKHNAVDTTAQTKSQIRHRKVGEAWTEESAESNSDPVTTLDVSGYALSDAVEWAVRTWGEHADPSPWSATATFTLSKRPVATITAPPAEVNEARITAAWSYFSAVGKAQAAWRANLTINGRTEKLTGTTESSATFAALAPNESSPTLTVEVQDADGLWSEPDELTFDVVYLPPAAVDVALSWDEETGRVYIDVNAQAPDEGVTDEVASVDILRAIDDGEEVLIKKGLGPRDLVYDALPTQVGKNTYRAVAHSALGAVAYSAPVEIVVSSQYSYLNWGPEFSEVARLWANQELSVSGGVESALVVYARDTRGTAVFGDVTSEVLSVAAEVDAIDASMPPDFIRAGQAKSIAAWRDGRGYRMESALLTGMGTAQEWAPRARVSFTLTAEGQS